MSRPAGWAHSVVGNLWHVLAPEGDPPLDVPVAWCGEKLVLVASIADHPAGAKCTPCELCFIADSSAGLARQDE